MIRNAARYVCAGGARVAVLLCATALCGPASERQLVLLIDRAGVEPKVLAAAQEDAARIFRYAGIDLIWDGCHSRQEGGVAVCGFDDMQLAQHPLFVQLIATEAATVSEASLGYARVDEQGGDRAAVFCQRLENLARDIHRRASRAQLLGHAMAHEIGHLLSMKHSLMGIMKARLSEADYERIGRGEMFFTPAEAAGMRATVRRLREGESR